MGVSTRALSPVAYYNFRIGGDFVGALEIAIIVISAAALVGALVFNSYISKKAEESSKKQDNKGKIPGK